MRPSWWKRKDESQAAFEAFRIYLGTDLQPGKRILADVAKELGKVHSVISKWAGMHDWVQRANDFDGEVQARQEEDYRIAATKWRQRRIEEAERVYKTHSMIQEKIQAMSTWPIVEVEDEVTERDEDGRPTRVTRVVPAKWRVKDMAEMLLASQKAMNDAYNSIVGNTENSVEMPDALPARSAAVAIQALIEDWDKHHDGGSRMTGGNNDKRLSKR